MIIIHLCGDTFNKKAAESRCNWLSKLNNLKCLELHYFSLGKKCFEMFLLILMSWVFQRRYSDSSQKSLKYKLCMLDLKRLGSTVENKRKNGSIIHPQVSSESYPLWVWGRWIRYLHQQSSHWLTNVNIIVFISVLQKGAISGNMKGIIAAAQFFPPIKTTWV